MKKCYLVYTQKDSLKVGLAKSLILNVIEFPLRIWIVDNSGSMSMPDGHRFLEMNHGKKLKNVSCTRWQEIQETVIYHAELAAILKAPTIFRILNPSAGVEEMSIADKGENMIYHDLRDIKQNIGIISMYGSTPLTRHVIEIRHTVQSILPSLSEGKRVAIILATDGLPSDERGMSGIMERNDFIDSLRSLEGLPIWVVIRLCTDDVKVINFYNELDSQLEMSIEVLDDFESEAKEIHKYNKYLNYTLAFHRCREMGFSNKLFDLLDERMLTKGELREFCLLLFREELDGLPDPDENWKGFLKMLSGITSNNEEKWDPIFGKSKKWIDLKGLNREYHANDPLSQINYVMSIFILLVLYGLYLIFADGKVFEFKTDHFYFNFRKFDDARVKFIKDGMMTQKFKKDKGKHHQHDERFHDDHKSKKSKKKLDKNNGKKNDY